MKGRIGVRKLAAAALAAAGLSLACGGGSSGGTGTTPTNGGGTPTPAASGTMGGMAMKGPVSDGTVTAFAVKDGAKGDQLGTARTDAQGRFTMQLGGYSGPVMMELRGGSYVDEATNATMPMLASDVMTCVLPSFDPAVAETIAITPVTSMAQAMAQGMNGGMTPENIRAANQMVGSYFSVGDVVHTMPMDPLVAKSGATATQDQKNYGMTIAAMSQYAMMVGMPSSSGMVTLMADDASDGTMNGMMGGRPISMSGMGGMAMMGGATTMMQPGAGTSGLATAMTQFVASGMNRSGVVNVEMQPLIDKLRGASGEIR